MTMDRTEFEQLVIEAINSLPPEFARYLANVEILIEPRPTADHRRRVGLKPWQTLYGLYEGVPLTRRSVHHVHLPDTIILFQEPLEHDFPSRIALRAQVRRTVFHEIAHLFGISDDRLRELGAY